MDVEKLLCAKTHEYLSDNEDGTYTIGLTQYAVEQLGDIVFLELPEAGANFAKGNVFATVESVKAAGEIYMPISGEVVEINEAVVDTPEILNENPYEEGWLIKIKTDSANDEVSDLMEYNDYIEEVK